MAHHESIRAGYWGPLRDIPVLGTILGVNADLSFCSPMLLNQLANHFVAGDLTMDPLPGQFLCVLGNRHALDSVTGIRNSLGGISFLGFRCHCHPFFLLPSYQG